MARVSGYLPFKVCHKTEVSSVIRGHHVYMSIWTSTVGEHLTTAPETREEAIQYDKFSIGVYKDADKEKLLVGHLPAEISSLCYHFLAQNADNEINAEITGKRRREVGLVVPAKLSFETNNRKCAEILEEELLKRREKFSTLELKFKKKGLYRKFPVYKKIKIEKKKNEKAK